MQVFVYEFITGGGLKEPPSGSLLTEGLAMSKALVEDFSRLPNVRVVATIDKRLETSIEDFSNCNRATFEPIDFATHRATFSHLCAESDATLVVAPEFSGILAQMTKLAVESGTRLLSPNVETVALFSDKQKTVDWLNSHAIPTTSGIRFSPTADLPRENTSSVTPPVTPPSKLTNDLKFPVVVKPLDGAGSMGVRKVATSRALDDLNWTTDADYRVESFVSGQPVSVSVLFTDSTPIVLPPCQQHFADQSFDYQGGRLLPAGELADRATRLAKQVAIQVPNPQGYMGIDMVLGEQPDGTTDRIIEINPRITTSYVGLRAATDGNLAERILSRSSNIDLRFPRRPLEFRSDGAVIDSGATILDPQRSEF